MTKKLNFLLLLTMSMATVAFNSCSKDVPIAVTNINLDKQTLTLAIGDEYTLTATVTPEDATNKIVVWISSDENKAAVLDGKVIAKVEGEVTIMAKADNQTAVCIITVYDSFHDEGIIINGVKWATRNVSAPGTFAATPQDAGMFYQWNRRTAWPATGDVTGWDSNIPAGDVWEKANDPSPAGWRVPTLAEIQTLFNTNKVKMEWIDDIKGTKFTDKTSDNSLFLPAAGSRAYNDGTLYIVGTYGMFGRYWSNTQHGSGGAYSLAFVSIGAEWGSNGRIWGFSVRAVAE